MMDLSILKTSAVKGFGHGLLIAKKYSPEVLTTVGVIGVVASGVFASKATLHLEERVDLIKLNTSSLKAGLQAGTIEPADYNKKMTQAYTRGTISVAKLYAPSVTLGLASIGCIVGAHGIMKKRNVALVAAYKAVESSFAKYRERVVEEFGEEKDQDFRLGLRDEERVDETTGKKVKVKVVDPNGISAYARFFDELSPMWEKTPEFNLSFLKCQQNWFNDRLQAHGHVFLNEVYDALGIPRSKAGSVVGWFLSQNGDNYIDFNIYDLSNPEGRRFVNGEEDSILLDFNVDGVINDLLDN